MLDRYAAEPAVAARTLLMEHLALALNPTQGLIGGDRLIDLIRAEDMTGVLSAFEVLLTQQTHAIYDVRRIISARKGDSSLAGNVQRSLRPRTTGSREELRALLDRFAADGAAKGLTATVTGDDGVMRLYQHRRGATFPTIERFFVVAPALAPRKENAHFDRRWAELVAPATPAAA